MLKNIIPKFNDLFHRMAARTDIHAVFYLQDGSEIKFKVEKSYKVSLIMHAYCEKKKIGSMGLRFILHGQRIQGNDTIEKVHTYIHTYTAGRTSMHTAFLAFAVVLLFM